jgi:hypothetical protein
MFPTVLSAGSAAQGAPGDYLIANSIRFRSKAGAFLSRAYTSNATWTLSAWVKRGSLGSIEPILGSSIKFNANDTLTAVSLTTTTTVYRDPSAWYHIVVSNSGCYVNGISVGSVTTSALTNTNIGGDGTHYFDGYLADINFIDGQALTPSSFGETSSTTGVWKPKQYAGPYGTNGFHLSFSDGTSATTLGYDSSGNGNNWTTNNISLTAGATYDWMIDSPTPFAGNSYGVGNYAVLNPLYTRKSTLSNANLTASGSTDLPTIIPTSGNWYFEIDGVSKNWTPPAAFPAAAGNYNFGQRPFANSVTAGYKSLCTYNLPKPSIVNGATQFAATTYTGTGSSLSVSGAAFKPDLVWIKSRSAATDNKLTDVIRGTTNALVSNSAAKETTDAGGVTAFNSNGFTIGTAAAYNTHAATYIAWQWKANGTGVSNTAGSISSTVSANTTAGFSVVTYTGTGVNATVGHGLGVAPSMVITKKRSGTSDWGVYHSSLTSADYHLVLDKTDAQASGPTYWNSTAPTSTVFSVGTADATNISTATYVAYCFAAIAGYSAFGSYTGNGGTNGPFVYCGFRPKFILIKNISAAYGWDICDTSLWPYNEAQSTFFANSHDPEISDIVWGRDILSNGFKLRNGGQVWNQVGKTYIYAAFCEVPFNFALGR